MIPLELVDTAALPDGGELRLMRRGQDYSILFGRNELMSSRLRGSEEALATLGCEGLSGHAAPRVLIGGLGMGFTLRAALDVLGPGATIQVAELIPSILAWAKGPLAHLYGECLDDPRATVRIVDVRAAIAAQSQYWDAILLDVDNGPDGLIHAGNDRLYSNAGLQAALRALKPGGKLAIWSAYADNAFTGRLRNAGFAVDERKVRATGGRKGAHHVIWIAARRG